MATVKAAQQGMALVLALVAVVIIAMLLSGSLLLVVSHLSLANTKSNYANALNLAEAGINWELWKISHDVTTADNAPATVQVPAGSGRSFQVHVEAYPGGGTWSTLGAFSVISTGTVDGVSRTVRIVARGYGLAGLYALFGINTLNIGGNATLIGAAGTNGDVAISGNPNLIGNFVYCGPNAGGDTVTPTGQVFYAPLAESFPTVNELANQRAWEKYGVDTALGVDFFGTTGAGGVRYNDNGAIKNALGQTVTIHNYTMNNQVFVQQPTAGATLWNGTPVPAVLQGKKIIVLGPGDYYFESFDVRGSNGIFIDDSGGVVNIWLGRAGAVGSADMVDGGSLFFTSHSAANFHLYQGSARDLQMTGTMDFYGSVYAYNGPSHTGAYYGQVRILGDGNITGSVIGYDVEKTTGSCTINFPSSGGMGSGGSGPGPGPGEPILFYGFEQSWQEVNPL